MPNAFAEEPSRRVRDAEQEHAHEAAEWMARIPPERLERVLALFDGSRVAGREPVEATSLLLEYAAGAIARHVASDGHVSDALRAMGLRAGHHEPGHQGLLLDMIAVFAGGRGIGPAHDERERFRLIHHISYSVLIGGGVNNVPSPECMAAHLPDDRKATPDELKQAWEACTR